MKVTVRKFTFDVSIKNSIHLVCFLQVYKDYIDVFYNQHGGDFIGLMFKDSAKDVQKSVS